MKLKDIIGVLQTHTLPLARSYQAEDNTTVFEFDTTGKSINWKAGQHSIFTLPEKNIQGKKWRAFSISSAANENVVQIATKISERPSNFKKALSSLQIGESIKLRGPYGWLYLQDDNSPIVMIAGGVGITPFRAIFKELEKGNHRDVTLIYSARDTHLFQTELDEIAKKDEKIHIVYTHTKEETDAAVVKVLTNATRETYYFISGAPSMVNNVSKTLRSAGITKNKILTDSFRNFNILGQFKQPLKSTYDRNQTFRTKPQPN
jgi:ferredoxin-NADP reductase